jgi:hypothetical protein
MKKTTVFCLAAMLVAAASAQDSLNVRRVGSCTLPDEAYAVALAGDYAYVADCDSGLRVISIADPTYPIEVGHANIPGRTYGLTVSGQYVYVAAETAGLRVISVADPEHPVEVGHLDVSASAHAVAISGQYAYVANDTSGLLDVSIVDPAQPTVVGSCGSIGQVAGVTVYGSRAYVSTLDGCWWIVSITDPAHPNVIGGGLIIGKEVLHSDADAGYAYVSTNYGLYIYSIVNPNNTPLVARCDIQYLTWGVALSRGYAFVAADEAGLRVHSITDPSNPSEVGHYDMTGWVNAVALTPNYIYVAYGREGLQVCQFYGGGVEETPGAEARATKSGPTVVRAVLNLQPAIDNLQAEIALLSVNGRRVLGLHPGANDVSKLNPGVYFVRSGLSAVGHGQSAVTKVVITR